VTGANKGIGFAICEALAKQAADLLILLGSRDEIRGRAAVEALKAKGCQNIVFISLNIDDEKNLKEAAEHIRTTYGGLDILINNAGIAWKGDAFDETVARGTIGTNYYGTIRATEALFPLIRPNGRVVNISSRAGAFALKNVPPAIRTTLLDPNLTYAKLTELLEQFIEDVKQNRYQEKGWPKSAYGMSKAGMSMYTRIFARDFSKNGILINCCCPGWVRTDMSGPKAPKPVEEGAETPLYLALLPDGPTGTFFFEKKQYPWVEP